MTIKEFEIQLALGSLPTGMKRELARDPMTPKRILTKLSTDKDGWIRNHVALNPNTTTEVLIKLSKDKSVWVRVDTARNSNTPKKILTELSTDEDWYVRYHVADNPNYDNSNYSWTASPNRKEKVCTQDGESTPTSDFPIGS